MTDIMFPVYERGLYIKDSQGLQPVSTHKAIIRFDEDNEQRVLGVVGRRYKVVHMQDLCNVIEDELKRHLPADIIQGMQVNDRAAYYGAQCFRDYVFPGTKKAVGRRSSVAFRVVVSNGYDGASSIKIYSGAIDFFCSNGVVTGSYDVAVVKHTSNLALPRIGEIVNRAYKTYYEQTERWSAWSKMAVSDFTVDQFYRLIPNISARRIQQLMDAYHKWADSHGTNVWAMYSAATFYASHDEGDFAVRDINKTDNAAATLMKREEEIMQWTESSKFQELLKGDLTQSKHPFDEGDWVKAKDGEYYKVFVDKDNPTIVVQCVSEDGTVHEFPREELQLVQWEKRNEPS